MHMLLVLGCILGVRGDGKYWWMGTGAFDNGVQQGNGGNYQQGGGGYQQDPVGNSLQGGGGGQGIFSNGLYCKFYAFLFCKKKWGFC